MNNETIKPVKIPAITWLLIGILSYILNLDTIEKLVTKADNLDDFMNESKLYYFNNFIVS